jgi:hypothetical protein
MGRPPWATAQQQEWLCSKISAYRDAQSARTLPDFFESTSAQFLKHFPPTVIADGLGQNAANSEIEVCAEVIKIRTVS